MFQEYLPCGSCKQPEGGCLFQETYQGRRDGYLRSVPTGEDAGLTFVSVNSGTEVECGFSPLQKSTAESAMVSQQTLEENVGGLAMSAA